MNTEEHVVPGTMTRDERAEWPDDIPRGTFDIDIGPLEGYPQASGHMLFVCPNGRRCAVLVGPESVAPGDGQRLHVWQWDGDQERPTLSPSLNCLSEKDGQPASGCGWHGFITRGVMHP